MNENNWRPDSLADRMMHLTLAMNNPCAEDEHTYSDQVVALPNGTMLSQMCTVCYVYRGWIYSSAME